MKPSSPAAEPANQADRQRFMSMMNQHLSELYDYVRHALAAREVAGDLTSGDLTSEDVVDDVILRAYREFSRNPEPQQVGDWLRRLAKERIRSEARRRRWEQEHSIHIEEDVPETSPGRHGRRAARAPAVRGCGAGRATATMAADARAPAREGADGRADRQGSTSARGGGQSYDDAGARLPPATSAGERLQNRCGRS